MENKTLHLNLKKNWFNMILAGVKTEEYRDIKIHWARQFLYKIYTPPTFKKGYTWAFSDLLNKDYECQGWNISTGGAPIFEEFDTITFSNGYAKDRPQMVIDFLGFEIREGKKEWGAEPGVKYFVLKLGKIIR